LVHYAKASAKYLAGIEAAVRRARYLAKLDGRDKANRADIKRAINESVIPSDSALSVAMATPQRGARRRSQASELTADYSLVNDRTNGTLEINLSDRKSELQPNQNRLEARRESDVLMPG
ncbi:MAG TPA: hypothetical protein VHC44_05605, partial [Verrucomicrobiae bacterium]|nr:hypothetical protein [Verrucomicrobiae bacterium]